MHMRAQSAPLCALVRHKRVRLAPIALPLVMRLSQPHNIFIIMQVKIIILKQLLPKATYCKDRSTC